MLDAAYVFGTVAFFGTMIAYGLACQALGREPEQEGDRS